MLFQWDETKRRANLAKHGIDFPDAVEVLCGSPWLAEDLRRDYGEKRCLAVGQCHEQGQGQVLVVAFTLRGEVFRIISVRRANARERRRYGFDT